MHTHVRPAVVEHADACVVVAASQTLQAEQPPVPDDALNVPDAHAAQLPAESLKPALHDVQRVGGLAYVLYDEYCVNPDGDPVAGNALVHK